MLTIFLKSAYRSMLKNKSFSILNVSGLAIALVVCFFIFQYVHFERSYEQHNPNAANIYRVPLEYHNNSGSTYTEATNYPAVGPAMKQEFPEVISFARLIPADIMLATSTISRKKGETTQFSDNEKRVYFADPTVLKMFSIPLINGDSSTALNQMRGIVISASKAKKYFGSENPVNQTLFLNGNFPVTVTGVFEDIPGNAHLKFDMLISFPDEKFQADNWSWAEFYTYILVSPKTNLENLAAKFPGFIERHLGSKTKQAGLAKQIFLQPIKDIHLNSHFRKEIEPNGYDSDIWLLSILSFFVLLLAYINYINLSTAKAIERAGEVGVRKVIGATKGQLISQFLVESIVINLLSLIVASVIVLFLAPFYEQLIGKPVTGRFWTSGIVTEGGFWIALSGILIGGPLLIGIYPALLTSRYKPVLVLKGKFYGSNNGIMLRKILSTFQFVLCILLIAGSLIVYDQLTYMRHQPLGYDKEHTLVIKTPGIYDLKEYPKIYTFQKDISENPAITDAGLCTQIPGEPLKYKSNAKVAVEAFHGNADVFINQVDNHFFDTYKVPLIAGRNFSQQDTADVFPVDGVSFPHKIPVIINESFLKNFGINSNESALSKLVTFDLNGQELRGEIIGVSKDYHQTSLKEPYQPTIYIFPSRAEWKYIIVNLSDHNLPRTMSFLESSYKKLFADNPFEFFFQDAYFNEQYKSDQQLARVFNVFTVLSIFISCMGLLGLLNFIMRVRYKEIGIRRILGASVSNILFLFYKEFFKLIGWSTLLAFPAIYVGGTEWLKNFAFHTSLGTLPFILPAVILIAITFIVVATRSLKTVTANPMIALKE